MKTLVVGTLAYDDVETPAGKREMQLGGSAAYFSIAASYFTDVGIVSIVGEDVRPQDLELLSSHGIDLSGVETAPGETFRWGGSYLQDINTAKTIYTSLNVFEQFKPALSDSHASSPYLFLANSDPQLQRFVLESMSNRPRIVAGDTMNHWIAEKPDHVQTLFKMLDIALINEAEASLFSGHQSLVRSSAALLATGLRQAVIKRGEYGVALFGDQLRFAAPAFPLAEVIDPTGAGDSFAGGFMGYLANVGKQDSDTLRRAVIAGSAIASMTVQDFGIAGIANLDPKLIQERYEAFIDLMRFTDNDNHNILPLK